MTNFNSKQIYKSKNSIKLVLSLIFPLINAFGLVIANWKIGKLIKNRCLILKWPWCMDKKEIYSQCYIFLLHIKEKGEVLVFEKLQEDLEYKVKTGTTALEQKKAFLASVWQLHEQICEECRQDHWGFPPLTPAKKFCQEPCLLHTDEKSRILIIILLIINKIKACRKRVLLSISGYDLFWQITLPDFKWRHWSVVRHQSRLRIWKKEKKSHVNIVFGSTS